MNKLLFCLLILWIPTAGYAQEKLVYVEQAGDFFFKVTVYHSPLQSDSYYRVDSVHADIFDIRSRRKVQSEIDFPEYYELFDKKDFPSKVFAAEDMNFDGQIDLRVISSQSNYGVKSYEFFIYRQNEGKFIGDSTMKTFSEPVFDQEKKEINTFGFGFCCETFKTYKYEDGRPVLVWEKDVDHISQTITITERINGKMVSVSKKKGE